jgi:hypothetical protein
MLAVTICHLNTGTPPQVLNVLGSLFGLSESQWDTFRMKPVHTDAKTLAKLKARCRPRLGAAQALSLDQAVRKGDTPRARHVLAYIQQADKYLESAQRALERFADTGGEAELENFVGLVLGSGVTSICHSFLFAALGHDSFPGNYDMPAERLVRLFSCNPLMYKRHLGKLLDLRFKNRLPLTSSDVLAGIFQMLGRPTLSTEAEDDAAKELVLNIPRLASCSEWARIRLEE